MNINDLTLPNSTWLYRDGDNSNEYLLLMGWVMRHTNNRKRSLRWKLTSVLEDLDYADDVALISRRFADLQEKTDRLVATAGVVGLKINRTSGGQANSARRPSCAS